MEYANSFKEFPFVPVSGLLWVVVLTNGNHGIIASNPTSTLSPGTQIPPSSSMPYEGALIVSDPNADMPEVFESFRELRNALLLS